MFCVSVITTMISQCSYSYDQGYEDGKEQFMKSIDELIEKVNDLQADCNDLYEEVRYYEKLAEVNGISSYSKEVWNFIDMYAMLKNSYFKGHISEGTFFDAMDSEVYRLRNIPKIEKK